MKSGKSIRIGTRGSLLARTQTGQVLDKVRQLRPDAELETVLITTKGDRKTTGRLTGHGTTGFFTREIEDALLDGRIDAAVHSLKDLPSEMRPGLRLSAVPARVNPRDALIGMTCAELQSAPAGTTIGTCSPRRKAQLLRMMPSCTVVDLRGNLDTRLRKVSEGELGCAVVALAGLVRIARDAEAAGVLEVDDMLPAPAQGALAVQTRDDDASAHELFQTVHCTESGLCTGAERTFIRALGAGCQAPVGALATVVDRVITLRGLVLSLDGSDVVEQSLTGNPDDACELGRQLAASMIDRGAGTILEKARKEQEELAP